MVMKYQTNSEPSIVNTADLITQLISRVDYLQLQLNALFNDVYTEQIINFMLNADRTIVRDTLIDFSLTIPLELNALSTGAIIAIVSLLIKEIFNAFFILIRKKLWPEHNSNKL